MKFLIDVCAASRPLLTTLADLGRDVLSARDRFPQASDEALLALAREEGRVLITEDKDFESLSSCAACRIRGSCGLSK